MSQVQDGASLVVDPPWGRRRTSYAHTDQIALGSSRRLARSRLATPAGWDLPATWLLIALGLWLVVANGLLGYPLTDAANAHTMKELGVAIVVVLGGLWLHQHRGSRPAAVLCLIGGVLLFLTGFTDGPHTGRMQLNEMIVGALITVVAASIAAAPNPYRALRAEETRRLLTPRPAPALAASAAGAGRRSAPGASQTQAAAPAVRRRHRWLLVVGMVAALCVTVLLLRRRTRSRRVF
jgi:hypothetical protein